MTNAQRDQFRRITVLKILSTCGSYLLPEPALHMQLSSDLGAELTLAELQAVLRWLEGEVFIAGITPELGGARKWKITDAGRLALSTI